ncbi:MAG: methylated-DNA--[protein]-cysteine S-methyltransferase [Acidobacteria bacterium]|nr:methylated-DNA--[protein]-cysteine S-methyltransferase [Acidobacteriota bacterium]
MNNVQLETVNPTRQDAQPIDAKIAWQQLCERNHNGRFFYAVTTTGVFCRPECKSRRPLRENVQFFATVADAQNAGFRACKRCRPTAAPDRPLDKVRKHLESNLDRAVPLAELGCVAGMSPFTVQRAFKQEMGVSPLQYQRSLKASRLRDALKQQGRVTDAIYDAGFGSSSRAYEGTQLGMTPARFAQGGKGEQIRWCSARSPFGWMVVGSTDRGLCWLSLGSTREEAEGSLREEFPAAELRRDASLAEIVEMALASVREGSDLSKQGALGAGLDLRGTVFQLRVWQALRQIPRGETRSYSELAREMGEPNATRAVARACATNRVALIVPCHRVVGADGSLTGYRWGVERKRELLEAERSSQ